MFDLEAQYARIASDGGTVANSSILESLSLQLGEAHLPKPYAFYPTQTTKVVSGQVEKVYDISGNSRDAVRVASGQVLQTVEGVQCIHTISAGKSFATTGTTITQPASLFVIYRRPGTGLRVLIGDGTRYMGTGNSVQGRALAFGTGLVIDEPEDLFYLVGGRVDGMNSRITRNGVQRKAGNGGSNGLANYALGGFPANSFVPTGEFAMWALWQNLSVAQENAIAAILVNSYMPILSQIPLVVCDGNSLTAGSGSTAPQYTYPNQLREMLGGSTLVNLFNFGVHGQTTPMMIADAATQVDPLYLAEHRANILVAWEIRNHMVGDGATKEVAYASYVSYCQARLAAHYSVCAVTVLPSSGLNNTDRAWVNNQIRANYLTFATVLADVAADPDMGPDGANLNLTYYTADQIHITDLGYTKIATIVYNAIDPLFP